MKKVFNLTLIAIALVAATMTSCKKTFGTKDVDFKYSDITENTHTVKVTDAKTGDVIEGAVIKDGDGEIVATTSAAGTATYIKKAGDDLIFTVEVSGYATMFASGSVKMYKLDGKFSGVATFSDKADNVKVVPSGTEITVQAVGDDFVTQIYKTTVGNEGKFEFTGLPNGAGFKFVSPTNFDGNSYNVNPNPPFTNSFTSAVVTTPKAVRYTYINTEMELIVLAYPGVVRAEGTIVIKFNKAIDKDFSSNFVTVGGSPSGFTEEWSGDNKTLTLVPNVTWGTVNTSKTVAYRFYTPAVNGKRQYVDNFFSVGIIE